MALYGRFDFYFYWPFLNERKPVLFTTCVLYPNPSFGLIISISNPATNFAATNAAYSDFIAPYRIPLCILSWLRFTSLLDFIHNQFWSAKRSDLWRKIIFNFWPKNLRKNEEKHTQTQSRQNKRSFFQSQTKNSDFFESLFADDVNECR